MAVAEKVELKGKNLSIFVKLSTTIIAPCLSQKERQVIKSTLSDNHGPEDF